MQPSQSTSLVSDMDVTHNNTIFVDEDTDALEAFMQRSREKRMRTNLAQQIAKARARGSRTTKVDLGLLTELLEKAV